MIVVYLLYLEVGGFPLGVVFIFCTVEVADSRGRHPTRDAGGSAHSAWVELDGIGRWVSLPWRGVGDMLVALSCNAQIIINNKKYSARLTFASSTRTQRYCGLGYRRSMQRLQKRTEGGTVHGYGGQGESDTAPYCRCNHRRRP